MNLRQRRQDTKHAVYMLVNTNTSEHYIGITVCGSQVKQALKVRLQKHVRRALTENKTWALCESIRTHGAEAFSMLLVDVVRGREGQRDGLTGGEASHVNVRREGVRDAIDGDGTGLSVHRSDRALDVASNRNARSHQHGRPGQGGNNPLHSICSC